MNLGADLVEQLGVNRRDFLISSLQVSGSAGEARSRHQFAPLGISPFHAGIHIRAGLFLRYQSGHEVEIIIVDVLHTCPHIGDEILVQLMACPDISVMGVIVAGIRLEIQTRNLQFAPVKVRRGKLVTHVVFRLGHAVKHVKTDFVVGSVQQCGMVFLLIIENGIPITNLYSSAP